ncbi:hypothetical protein HYD94_02195 [Mycoplasmopsis bovis]|uniref:hypothetical protein n=1 Tax=Mycoplasmopsis bovis TaxID=28903 RepID=UPI001937A795|nr:hypothetical protein [Mycoplasmopsis bovis]QQH22286.1 hypothetical protein HYE32_02175 [Mycoplasmopsis bovis]QQH34955.1 hypothetical protein HYD94_02195 [Mycoplasmopsis bovis]QQH61005.1 hypothetical protein HYD59_02270 [Mycoplasmopsis bovis]QQH72312.1 hypothetical protein HYD52_02210 [Mycoplasmopsis bovis]WHL49682.1 hypothetical protein HYE36_06390 [Mycoplasmopsis bovis]
MNDKLNNCKTGPKNNIQITPKTIKEMAKPNETLFHLRYTSSAIITETIYRNANKPIK